MTQQRTMYQIFVSSTYRDLHKMREDVTWAILKTRNVPSGMEAFPSTDDRGWKVIQRTIDDSDLYVLLLGFRYGSIEATSLLSWTHKEYRYAKEKGIPILAFLRHLGDTPGDQVDEKRKKIDEFRKEVEDNHKVTYWSQGDDLAAAVSQTVLLTLQDCIDEGTPRPGWIRGPQTNARVAEELALLLEENRQLTVQNEALRKTAKDGDVAHSPALLIISAGSSRSSAEYSKNIQVQNVGSCGFIVEHIRWLWAVEGSRVIVVDQETNIQNRPFIPPNQKSEMKFVLTLGRAALDAVGFAGTMMDFESKVQVTVMVTAKSTPHSIRKTETLALNGSLLRVLRRICGSDSCLRGQVGYLMAA